MMYSLFFYMLGPPSAGGPGQIAPFAPHLGGPGYMHIQQLEIVSK